MALVFMVVPFVRLTLTLRENSSINWVEVHFDRLKQ
jgi:hypothetical protein